MTPEEVNAGEGPSEKTSVQSKTIRYEKKLTIAPQF